MGVIDMFCNRFTCICQQVLLVLCFSVLFAARAGAGQIAEPPGKCNPGNRCSMKHTENMKHTNTITCTWPWEGKSASRSSRMKRDLSAPVIGGIVQ